MGSQSNTRRIIVGCLLMVLGTGVGLHAWQTCIPEKFWCNPGVSCDGGIMVNEIGFPIGCFNGAGQYHGMCQGYCQKCMASSSRSVCVYTGNVNDECNWVIPYPPPAYCGFYGYADCMGFWPNCMCDDDWELGNPPNPFCFYQACVF
jgi:hypothetical protein